MGYDVIGDIHGQAHKQHALLNLLRQWFCLRSCKPDSAGHGRTPTRLPWLFLDQPNPSARFTRHDVSSDL